MALRIAIIGAGPAGCALARLLQQSSQDISVNIFESEASINFRSQGGTLDLYARCPIIIPSKLTNDVSDTPKPDKPASKPPVSSPSSRNMPAMTAKP